MLVRNFFVPVLLAVSSLIGCATEEAEKVDFTSREALKKAETFPHGCSYVETVNSTKNGDYGSSKTPRCQALTQGRCSDITPPAAQSYGASMDGYTYLSSESTWYDDRQDFVGTCDDPQPISCDYLIDAGDACSACMAKSCCAPTFFCDSDPNCGAIAECVKTCKDDAACQKRCIEHGDDFASKNFVDALRCMTSENGCAEACAAQ